MNTNDIDEQHQEEQYQLFQYSHESMTEVDEWGWHPGVIEWD